MSVPSASLFIIIATCILGNDCPFSHDSSLKSKTIISPCTWFIKGSCRFGHRCALSHVLPGQPQSMDKKNKKQALQLQKNLIKDSLNKVDDLLKFPLSNSLNDLSLTNSNNNLNANQLTDLDLSNSSCNSNSSINNQMSIINSNKLSQSLSSFQSPSIYYNWNSTSFSYLNNNGNNNNNSASDEQLEIDDFDDDLFNGEEFLPSSLDELLTPLERRRKHSSRTSSISSAFTLSPNSDQNLTQLPNLNKLESSTLTLKPKPMEDETQFDLEFNY